MPVPKRKRSRARRDSRFANKGLDIQSLTSCSQCNEPLMTHSACRSCGFYKGRKVLSTKADRAVKRIEMNQAKKAQAESAQPKSGE